MCEADRIICKGCGEYDYECVYALRKANDRIAELKAEVAWERCDECNCQMQDAGKFDMQGCEILSCPVCDRSDRIAELDREVERLKQERDTYAGQAADFQDKVTNLDYAVADLEDLILEESLHTANGVSGIYTEAESIMAKRAVPPPTPPPTVEGGG